MDADSAVISEPTAGLRPRQKRSAGNGEAPCPLDPTAPLDITRAGDEFLFAWSSLGVAVGITQLRESSDGLRAELTVQSSVAREPLLSGGANLSSIAQRRTLAKDLGEIHSSVPWRAILERVCWNTAQQFRAGAPVQVLRPVRASVERYLIDKLLPAGETTVTFGDGGAGKSLFALAAGVAVATKTPLPHGLQPTERTNVLILDWESTQGVGADRLACFLAGLNLSEAPGLYYRPMYRALADDATHLRVEMDRRGVGLVIIDSFGPACGAEPEGADAAIRLMNALRTFAPATRLVVAHVSKFHAEQRSGPSRPFGSVYVQNLARSVWEVRRPQEDAEGDVVPIGLFHRKVNQGKRFPPIGLRFEFQDGLIRLHAQDLGKEPELMAHASVSYRLLQALSTGKRTVEELAKTTETSENSVRVMLGRLEDKGKVIKLDEVRDRKNLWGLKA